MSEQEPLFPESTTDAAQGPSPDDLLTSLWNGAEDVIAHSLLFRSLDEQGRRELVHRGVLMVFAPSHSILREGEVGSDFFLVDRGVVEVVTTKHEGSPVVLATLQRGAFFGEVAMLTGMPRTASVNALTDVSVIRFDKQDIDTVLNADPGAMRLVKAMVAGRAKDTLTRAVLVSSRSESLRLYMQTTCKAWNHATLHSSSVSCTTPG
jgi:CRP/FNR family transcriptional regulator, cyclic AMP receptor protein